MDFPFNVSEDCGHLAASYVESYFSKLNEVALSGGHEPLIKIVPPATISSIVSDLVIAGIAKHSQCLIRNPNQSGYPDLIPEPPIADFIPGIEVKSSKNDGRWQGHNVERGWFMGVKYSVLEPGYDIIVDYIGLAELEFSDWTFFGRKPDSKRTPTASINKYGKQKIKNSLIYKR